MSSITTKISLFLAKLGPSERKTAEEAVQKDNSAAFFSALFCSSQKETRK